MQKLTSRKFILTVATAMQIVGLVAAYVVGQGYVDGKEKEASK